MPSLHSQDAEGICDGIYIGYCCDQSSFIACIVYQITGTSMCSDGEIQLIGGDSEREGRVEMCRYNLEYGGGGGSVCL